MIKGYISPSDATNEPRSMWVESDLVVRLRIANEPVPETVDPSDLLTRDSFSALSYKVYREVDGSDALVEGYESVAITVDDVIPLSLPRAWGKDGTGYNFRHVVPAEAFAANALHRVVYRFVDSDGVTTQHCVSVYVQGPTGDVASAGTGTVTGDPGPPGQDGEDGLPGLDGGAAILFCQTATVTVSNSAANTTLLGAGEGSSSIAADTQAIGDEMTFEAAGVFSTRATTPGNAVLTFYLGTEVTLAFPSILMLPLRSDARWKLRVKKTRRTIGPTGQAMVEGELVVDMGSVVHLMAGTAAAVTIPTDAIKASDIKIDWDTADAGNSWSMQTYSIKQESVAA